MSEPERKDVTIRLSFWTGVVLLLVAWDVAHAIGRLASAISR